MTAFDWCQKCDRKHDLDEPCEETMALPINKTLTLGRLTIEWRIAHAKGNSYSFHLHCWLRENAR